MGIKKGKKVSDNEVDAITGATISSKAVVRIINESNDIWLARLPASGEEPGPIEIKTTDQTESEPGE